MKLKAQKIRKNLNKNIEIHLYDSIDSTNDEAKRRMSADRGIHLYAAASQTAGRGRRGHSFYSPEDTGLYMTLSLPCPDDPADVQFITCIAAVAVCEAIAGLSDKRPQIKWVNDIFIGGKKAAGILTELVTDCKNQPRAVIIGIGLNLCTPEFPDDFAENAGNIGDIDINALCCAIANELVSMYHDSDNYSVLEKYKKLNLCIGRTVTYLKDGRLHNTQAVDIAPDGGLVVRENGELIKLNSGEISVDIDS